jgi:hypothetical protein
MNTGIRAFLFTPILPGNYYQIAIWQRSARASRSENAPCPEPSAQEMASIVDLGRSEGTYQIRDPLLFSSNVRMRDRD